VLLKDDPEEPAAALAALPGITAVRPDEAAAGRNVLDGDRSVDEREPIFRLAVARGWVLLELAEEKVSLEDIFVRLTTQDVATTSAAAAEAESEGEPPPPDAGREAAAGEEVPS
jgi:hypothetical protein